MGYRECLDQGKHPTGQGEGQPEHAALILSWIRIAAGGVELAQRQAREYPGKDSSQGEGREEQPGGIAQFTGPPRRPQPPQEEVVDQQQQSRQRSGRVSIWVVFSNVKLRVGT